ncbi:MAG: cyclic nucleotide-binding domain-containing protein [Acidimicrobiia bacterium]
MRYEASVTTISWIPSEAVSGPMRIPMDIGIGHYDEAPPARLTDLDELARTDRFRFANRLSAYVEMDGDRVSDAGYTGGGIIGVTKLKVGPVALTVKATAFPDLRAEPEITPNGVRFVQSAGGRTGAPFPRRSSEAPFLRIIAPTAWTTLALTIGRDGAVSHEIVGASPFPRHWVYDEVGELVAKSGLIDFSAWSGTNNEHTPWGGGDRPVLVGGVETAVERGLSVEIMSGGCEIRTHPAGTALTTQGERADEVFLLLDGMVDVSVDGVVVGAVAPGAIIGERAALERGFRTSTVRATTEVKVAVARPGRLDPEALGHVAAGHHREHP